MKQKEVVIVFLFLVVSTFFFQQVIMFTVSQQITGNVGLVKFDVSGAVPIFTPLIPNLTAVVPQPFFYDVNATEPDNQSFFFFDNATFFDIDNVTGIISFIPDDAFLGEHDVLFTVSDFIEGNFTQVVPLRVFAGLIGNLSDIKTVGVSNLTVKLGNVTLGDSTKTGFLSQENLSFFDGDELMAVISHDFTKGSLPWSSLFILKNPNGIIVKVSGGFLKGTKVLRLKNRNFDKLCVEDADIGDLEDISEGCVDVNEVDFSSCLVSDQIVGDITCVNDGGVIVISGLQHSGVVGSFFAVPSAPAGAPGRSACEQRFECSDWGDCLPSNTQTRVCVDVNRCLEKRDIPDTKLTLVRFPPETVKGCKYVQCFSGVLDGDESDVDCGGSCSGCIVGFSCNLNSDCLSNNCDSGVCVVAERVLGFKIPVLKEGLPIILITAFLIVVLLFYFSSQIFSLLKKR